MNPNELCPQCQTVPQDGRLDGLCPRCLWATLLEPKPDENSLGGMPAQGLGRFGDYDLLEEIARGGMGIVYRARHLELGRVVALKMLPAARLPGEADLKRFRAEAEAVATLDHPHIIPVYDVGQIDGRCFFTMKLARGGSLARRREEFHGEALQQGRPERIVILLSKVARAIHHAHQHGVLHRDLKPSNILLDEQDEPWVTDFGLAKQLDQPDDLTLSGMILGTPAYMAPEQAAGLGRQATTSADVYSLGAILYELLCGAPPFQGPTPLETLRQVLDIECPRPSSRNPRIDRDLETMVLKCLQKSPGRRYASAEALAEDLDRWLRGEAILARRAPALERAWRWARRRPAAAVAVALAVAAPAAIIAVLLASNARVRHANERTAENLYAADLAQAWHSLSEGNLGQARSTLQTYHPNARAGSQSSRTFEWRLFWSLSEGDQTRILAGFPGTPFSIAATADGRTLAIGGADYIWTWDLTTAQPTVIAPQKDSRRLEPAIASNLIARLAVPGNPFVANGKLDPTPGEIAVMVNPDHPGGVTRIAFSPNQRQLLTSTRLEGRAVRVWNRSTGTVDFALPAVYSDADFSPSNLWVAATSFAGHLQSGTTRVFDLEKGAELWRSPFPGGLAAFSADGNHLAVSGWDANAKFHRLCVWTFPGPRLKFEHRSDSLCTRIAISRDGRWVATASVGSPVIQLHSSSEGGIVRPLEGHAGAIRALAFSPDADLLASAGVDQVLRLWSVPSGQPLGVRRGHTDEIVSIGFLRGSSQIATASRDGTARLWDTASIDTHLGWDLSAPITEGLIISPQAAIWVATDVSRHAPLLWTTRPGIKATPLTDTESTDPTQAEAFDVGGSSLIVSRFNENSQRVHLDWHHVGTRERVRTLELEGAVDLGRFTVRACSSAAGLYAQGQADGTVRVWSMKNGRLLQTLVMPDLIHGTKRFVTPTKALAFSPDGRALAAGLADYSQVTVFELPSGAIRWSRRLRMPGPAQSPTEDPGKVHQLGFSPDGTLLASADLNERAIRLWDAREGRESGPLAGHRDHTRAFAFAPDGQTLASTGADGTLKLWHLRTRRETATILDSGASGPVAFSSDGVLLLVGVSNKVRAFHAPPL